MRNKKIILWLVCCAFAVVATAGCDAIPFFGKKKEPGSAVVSDQGEVKGVVVARVNNDPITLDELDSQVASFNAMVVQQGGGEEAKIRTTEQKINFLRNTIIRRRILYQEALRRGYDKNEDVRKALASYKRELLVAMVVEEDFNKIDVSKSDIEKYYNSVKEELRDPEERKVTEIVTSTEQEAKEIQIKLIQGQDMAALARQASKGPTASTGGDVGYVKNDPLFTKDKTKWARSCEKFYEIVFASTFDEGSLSNVFRCSDGYYIVKFDKKKESKPKPLNEELSNLIKQQIQFEKFEEMFKSVSQNTKIDINEENIR